MLNQTLERFLADLKTTLTKAGIRLSPIIIGSVVAFISLVLIVLAGLVAIGRSTISAPEIDNPSAVRNSELELTQITIDTPNSLQENFEITAEVARTDSEKEIGLMNRAEIADTEGMIFIYDSPEILNFWMKDTYVSLDIIFIDENKTIIKIYKSVEPNNTEKIYSSETAVKYALELKAGTAEKYALEVGDKLNFAAQ